ncbi:hypothetical protein [Paraburkholderia sp. J67]|uniref:hypothetical protein n=1 Tax=Paraburkholderia sp. J67 TaxID=2805435 RepID=UPI002ABE769A|nr:hypothetical protein [Paraburkholderia sp. J67]
MTLAETIAAESLEVERRARAIERRTWTLEAPLGECLAESPPAARDRLVAFMEQQPLPKVLATLRRTYESGQRAASYLISETLTARGVPPAFRGLTARRHEYERMLDADLFTYDAQWIVTRYPTQVESVRYDRNRQLFRKASFHPAARFLFHSGIRTPGEIAGGLGLSDVQQWECVYIRSRQVTKRAKGIDAVRGKVRAKLAETIYAARNRSFVDSDADASVERRIRLWECSRMFGNSPSEVARRYEQMAGEPITRQLAAKQLAIIEKTTKAIREVERAQ